MSKKAEYYQKRYRLKKKLETRAANILDLWQVGKMGKSSRSIKEVKTALKKITCLPYKWTDEDYDKAKNELSVFQTNLFSEHDLDLQKDIAVVRNNPTETEKATQKMQKAYVAALQTLELATDNPAEQAAAIIQMARFVGRRLAYEKEIPQSDAVAFCLSLLPKSYIKPDWLLPYMETLVKKNCENLQIVYGEQ